MCAGGILICHDYDATLQTLQLEASPSSPVGVYHIAVQQATGLVFLAHNRCKSVLALHVVGTCQHLPLRSQCSEIDEFTCMLFKCSVIDSDNVPVKKYLCVR